MSWTLDSLNRELQKSGFFSERNVSSQQQSDSIILTFHDFGDLPLVLVVGEKQILIEAALVERHEFENPSDIDYKLLCTHKILPLSTICIENINGTDWYVLFEALSVQSKLIVVIEEVLALVANTFQVIDSLEPLYKFNQKDETR